MEHHGFPADETLAEFIDGRLDAEGRQRVVEHLATCPECYDTFLTATEFAAIHPEDAARPAGGEVVRGRFGRNARYAAAAVFAVLAVGLVAFRETIGTRYDTWAFGNRTGVAQLIDAARHEEFRPVEPRFSGGFEYRQAKPRMRGPEDSVDQPYNLQIEALRLSEAAEHSKTKEYGAAVGEVFMGEPDKGAARLERILAESTGKKNLAEAVAASDDKRLLNDLAAAWIARSERRGELRNQDLERALAAADRALKLDPRYAEAAYNRALALDHLDRDQEAIDAWTSYQTIETDPQWLKEAQERIARAREDLEFTREALPPSR